VVAQRLQDTAMLVIADWQAHAVELFEPAAKAVR
jgi:hypothetical protein